MTGTGVVRLDTETKGIASLLAQTKPRKERVRTVRGKSVQLLQHRAARLTRLSRVIINFAQMSDLVVVEAPSYASDGGAKHDRSGLWWLVVGEIEDTICAVAEVAPKSRPLYATGDGNADKQTIMRFARKDYDIELDDDNVADALVLAAMGARQLGEPVECQRVTTHWQERALRATIWPEIERGNER